MVSATHEGFLMTDGASWVKSIWRIWRLRQPINAIATRLGRLLIILGSPADWFLEHLPYRGRVRLPLPNGNSIQIISHGDDYLINLIYWSRVYEPETFPLFFNLAKRSRATFDVGAHVGTFALAAAAANPQGQVYAFEPLPEIYQRLVENVNLNGYRNIQTLAVAAGEKEEMADFFFTLEGGIPSNSSLRDPTGNEKAKAQSRIPIKVVSLDHLSQELGITRVDLIKIDTEGTELDVLKGLRMILERDRPNLICEILDGVGDAKAVEDYLRPFAYQAFRLEPSGPRPLASLETHPTWWNYLFTTQPNIIRRK